MAFNAPRVLAVGGAFAICVATASSAAPAASPESGAAKSGARPAAVASLSGSSAPATGCLTPVVQAVRSDPQHATASARRSVNGLLSDGPLPAERRASDVDGTVVRYTLDRASFDRVDLGDENANGRPDVVDGALVGIARAQHLLVGQMELPSPGPVEVVLGHLGGGVEGIAIPSQGRWGRVQIWLDPSPRGGAAGVRRAAEHQFAHAVASLAGLDPAWGEAFASWVGTSLEGGPDERGALAMSRRIASAGGGLVVDDPDQSQGNALWFSFLEESFGSTAVKLAVEELGRGGSDQAALDSALRRATGDSLDQALRDYQLWSYLVGSRDDKQHFSFGSKLAAAEFDSIIDALPALSVQGDPEIGPMGGAATLLSPGEKSGGLALRFEGDPGGRWGADALIVHSDGSMHRATLPLDQDGAADLTIPLQDTREVVLLVRNLEPEGRPERRYTLAAHFEPTFPAEISAVRAVADGPGRAIVSWSTETEQSVLGFNVLRLKGEGGRASRVNPVWIPAVGDARAAAAYSFLDVGLEPGVDYRYRVEAVTPEGLSSRSDEVRISPAP